jgi:hypothetical protein
VLGYKGSVENFTVKVQNKTCAQSDEYHVGKGEDAIMKHNEIGMSVPDLVTLRLTPEQADALVDLLLSAPELKNSKPEVLDSVLYTLMHAQGNRAVLTPDEDYEK